MGRAPLPLRLAALLLSPLATATAQDDGPRTFTGTVVDETGAPIAGAAIGLAPRAECLDTTALLAAPATTTADDGTFSITVSRHFDAEVVAAAKGRQASATFVHHNAESAALPTFVLPPGEALIGRVRDESGAALAGVEIRIACALSRWGFTTHNVRSGAISDARGIFRVPCVPSTGLRLTASLPGHQSIQQIVSHESPLSLTLAPTPMARGRLTDAQGAPLADVSIRLSTEATVVQSRTVKTDQDGAFAIEVPPAPYRYRVHAYVGTSAPHKSKLLCGAADDVVVAAGEHGESRHRSFVLHAVDAATGERLPTFSAALGNGRRDPQIALFHADRGLRDYEQEAVLERPYDGDYHVVVMAPGHAFEIVAVPDEPEGPVVARLGPEAVLTGRVLDETGAPVVGVAVRALPDGNSSGSGGGIGDHWPRTDADGRYRIGGLQPGAYQVQVYASDRQAPAPVEVDVALAKPATLDLTLPRAKQVRVEVTGDAPPGPAPTLRLSHWQHASAGFQHHVAAPAPITLQQGVRSYPFGIQQGPRVSIELFVPSRSRAGAGTTFEFPYLDVVDGAVQIEMPSARIVTLRGRIEVETRLPAARIAIAAIPEDARAARGRRTDKVVAGVSADGSFAIDLLEGDYVLQLADVATGIVFHTEPREIAADTDDVVLRPKLRWLDLKLSCQEPGRPVVIQNLGVEIDSADAGVQPFLSGPNLPPAALDALPWLVPPGDLKLIVYQAPRMLERHVGGYRFEQVATPSITIEHERQTLEVTVPAAPSDEALEAGK